MKIVVLNGTEIKGCTHNMKEIFLKAMGEGHEIEEYYFPKDCPVFCTGCKRCFNQDISVCPHAEYTAPIWESVLRSDLIVVTSPSYGFGPTAQIKAVLDHFATKWMAHSPEKELFSKQAVIITNAAGAGTGNAIKVIDCNLSFWGISKIYVIEQKLFDTRWEFITNKRKKSIEAKSNKAAKKINLRFGKIRASVKTRTLFVSMGIVHRMLHKSDIKKGYEEKKDYRYWLNQGWFDGKKPWRNKR